MNLFLYLLDSFLFRIYEFFKHWYYNSFRIYAHFIVSLLETFDRTIALRVTFTNLFEPLYQERNIIGYLLGFIFRSLRLLLGTILYVIVIVIAVTLYLAWLAIPLYIGYNVLREALY